MLVYAMNLSLDGYVDHLRMRPDAALFAHWTDYVASLAGCIYGRHVYQIMQYWDEDQPGWGDQERAYAAVWRRQRKWVVSRTLAAVGPNATLLTGDLETAIRALKAGNDSELSVSGPDIAQSLGDLGLIDEYRLYYHPVVMGHGTPFFAGSPPPLRLIGSDRIGPETVRLAYVPV